jgi:thioredoxin-related protein
MLFRRLVITLSLLLIAGFAQAQSIGDDGLHKQPWLVASTGDIRLDLSAAAADGKDLIVIVEQQGCAYCAQLHAVNFTRSEITDLVTSRFRVVQLDLWGKADIIDFDGNEVTQQALLSRWDVNTTPTTMVLSAAKPVTKLADAEIFRLPGYLKPFYYLGALEFFTTGAYADQEFRDFFAPRVAALEAKGLDPEQW